MAQSNPLHSWYLSLDKPSNDSLEWYYSTLSSQKEENCSTAITN